MAPAYTEVFLNPVRLAARLVRRARLILLLLAPALCMAAAPSLDPGVSLTLAQWRAERYRDIHYAIDFDLQPGATRLEGLLEIRVSVASADDDLVLDWRSPLPEERIRDIHVNGLPAFGVRFVADHLVIPGALLTKGENRVALRFQSPVSTAGTAVTRYVDREDGAEYLYTLFVPADASSVFPCFDQPDLKASFTLSVSAPQSWKVVSNSPLRESFSEGANLRHRFAATPPISTYLVAFAAGPFVDFAESSDASAVRLYARRSRAERARKEAPELLRINRAAMRWLGTYFDQPFPFAKYDLVLIPELAYGGMEHAGASFLREESVLFPFEPGEPDLLRRANLLLHETSHQWFGDLVTMRWFDDLWLKEGFANFMAAKAMEALLPEFPAWVAFHSLKTSAYRTDATRGTTAIHQPMANLAAAKSAYGNIVYAKAPAILRQAEFFLGEPRFREGVRAFLKRHAWTNAGWGDLVDALERASGEKLGDWASAWVERAGMPRVSVQPVVDRRGQLREIVIGQQATGAGPGARSAIWPMKLRVQVLTTTGARQYEIRVVNQRTTLRTPGAGKPLFLFANDGDFGYGHFPLDAASRRHALDHPELLRDDLLRSLVHESLWNAVRDAELDPARYVELVLAQLPRERNEILATTMLARLRAAVDRYLGEARRAALAPRIEEFLFSQMQSATSNSRRIACFRAFADLARSERGRARVKDLLAGRIEVPGIRLASRDRYRLLQTLIAAADDDAGQLLEQQSAADTSNEGRRYSFAAAAAMPDAATKRALFARFLDDPRLPEAWIEEALGPFNTLSHAALTAPLLEQALAALPRIRRERRIFFVNDWLDGFIGGQTSRGSLEVVERFLSSNRIEQDLRLKILEAVDTLERTVRVRERFDPR